MKENDVANKKMKETILRGSPLLELFLSDMFVNRNEWVELMTEPFKELHERFTGYYGDNFIDMLKPLKVVGESFRLFSPDYPENARGLILNAVVIMGCEIGDKKITNLFSADIVKRLVEIRSFDQLVLADKESKLIASTFITSVLNTGIEWSEEVSSQNPDEFSDFINGLDI